MAQIASASINMQVTLLPGAVLSSDVRRIDTDKALLFWQVMRTSC